MAHKGKLLIVDDDAHIRRLLRIYLRDSPYDVFEAATGDEAVTMLDQHHFEVVLLDLILPYSGGFSLCQRFKRAGASSPHVIIMTGEDSAETRETARDCGADDFLAKPFEADQVRDRLTSLAARKIVSH
jgi:DNA-binding response OmpR family regulator